MLNIKSKDFLYKDNESDIVIAIINGNSIFKKLSKIYKLEFYDKNCSKFNLNDNNYIFVNSCNEIYEFITFHKPLIIIFVFDNKNIRKNLKEIIKLLEINNNLIIINKSNLNLTKLNVPVIKYGNWNKLTNEILKNSYEKGYLLIKYEQLENEIKKIENYLSKFLNFKNLRILSILLLKDYENTKNLILKYLNYDIENDDNLELMIKKICNKYNDLELIIENTINFKVEELYKNN